MSTVPYFEKLLAEHGDSPRSLDWSEIGQQQRFRSLVKDFVLHKSTLVDVGCGLGHLLRHLHETDNDWGLKYIGVDASETMIKAAEELAKPARHGTFKVLDVFKQPLPRADHVVASGLLNVIDDEMKDSHYVKMTELLQKCFTACKIGCAINMLSSHAPNQRRDRYYYSPNDMLTIAFGITRRVTIRHDYLPNDFTLVLRK